MHCQYNFKPTNFNFLILSRLSLAAKKKRIHKFVRKRITERTKLLQKSQTILSEKESKAVVTQRQAYKLDCEALEIAYPKIYKEKVAPYVKR